MSNQRDILAEAADIIRQNPTIAIDIDGDRLSTLVNDEVQTLDLTATARWLADHPEWTLFHVWAEGYGPAGLWVGQ